MNVMKFKFKINKNIYILYIIYIETYCLGVPP